MGPEVLASSLFTATDDIDFQRHAREQIMSYGVFPRIFPRECNEEGERKRIHDSVINPLSDIE